MQHGEQKSFNLFLHFSQREFFGVFLSVLLSWGPCGKKESMGLPSLPSCSVILKNFLQSVKPFSLWKMGKNTPLNWHLGNQRLLYTSNEQNIFICNEKERNYKYMPGWHSHVIKKARTVAFPHLDIFETKSSFILKIHPLNCFYLIIRISLSWVPPPSPNPTSFPLL